VQEDHFSFQVKIPKRALTRRGILSTVASLAPVLLVAKHILQDLCKLQLGWDEVIGESEAERWTKWLKTLPALNNVKIPRCFKPHGFGTLIEIHIHHFADPSSYGYGASSYLRLIDHKGSICLSFLMGKSKLALIKSISIPRLELSAAVLAVRLDKMIGKELDLAPSSLSFWIDSTVVLYCIRNKTKRFPVFVANRLVTIKSLTAVQQWHHIPSELNPADTASRGIEAGKFSSVNWLQGPSFLLHPQPEWPSSDVLIDESHIELLQVKTQNVQTII